MPPALRRPSGRVSAAIGGALVLLLFSGCTDTPSASPEGGGSDADDAQPPGPFAGVAPGVDDVVRAHAGAAAIMGVVYDVDTGALLSGATVTVTCARGALPATSESLVTTATGAFAFAAMPTLTGCTSLDYEITLASYRMAIPLSSGPLSDATGYQVFGGLVPTTP